MKYLFIIDFEKDSFMHDEERKEERKIIKNKKLKSKFNETCKVTPGCSTKMSQLVQNLAKFTIQRLASSNRDALSTETHLYRQFIRTSLAVPSAHSICFPLFN